MRASSRASLATALTQLDAALQADVKIVAPVSEELFSLADMIWESPRLSRSLTDTARKSAEKQALAKDLFKKSLNKVTLEIVSTMAGGRWAKDEDFATACRLLARHLLLQGAYKEGKLEDVEKEIFAVFQLLQTERELRAALTDSRLRSEQSRIDLVNRLFAKKLDPISLRLVEDVVATSKAGRLLANLRAICDDAAAIRSRGMATITTAAPLSDAQLERVAKALRKSRGQDMVINVVIDPTVIGGMKIRYGDEVVDGSISNRIVQTRRQLVG